MLANFLRKIIVSSPFFPHWLEFLKADAGTKKALSGIQGRVLEVGAGDGRRKKHLLKHYPKITDYVSTDYSSWDKEFEKINDRVEKNKGWKGIFFVEKKRDKLDMVCSATNLPFKNDSFDYHLSFEVLEHISEPYTFFSEASRILKPGGRMVIIVPFLYRMHGGEEQDHQLDFFRYAHGFFFEAAKKNSLKVKKIYYNTGVGTTIASLANQHLVRKIMEGNWTMRIVLFPLSPLYFCFFNLFGYVFDLFPDKRFSTRFHVVMEKIDGTTGSS